MGGPRKARRSGPRSRSPPWTRLHKYKNAIDGQAAEAVAVLDAFHVVKVGVDYRCAQPARSAYPQDGHWAGRAVAEKILATLPSCPNPRGRPPLEEAAPVARCVPGLFDTGGASGGGTEASTASSSSTDASTEASETETTTGSGASSSAAASPVTHAHRRRATNSSLEPLIISLQCRGPSLAVRDGRPERSWPRGPVREPAGPRCLSVGQSRSSCRPRGSHLENLEGALLRSE